MLRIRVEDRKAETTRSLRLVGQSFLIGSSADSNVLLTGVAIAPRHALLERHGNGLRLTSLDLDHEVLLNGELLQRGPVSSGDEIEIGHYRLSVQMIAEASPSAPAHGRPDPEEVQLLRNKLRAKRNQRARKRRVWLVVQLMLVVVACTWVGLEWRRRKLAREQEGGHDLATNEREPGQAPPLAPAHRDAAEVPDQASAELPQAGVDDAAARPPPPIDSAPLASPSSPAEEADPSSLPRDDGLTPTRKARPPTGKQKPSLPLLTMTQEVQRMITAHREAKAADRPPIERQCKALTELYREPMRDAFGHCAEQLGKRLDASPLAAELDGLIRLRQDLDGVRSRIAETLATGELPSRELLRELQDRWGRIPGGAPDPKVVIPKACSPWFEEAHSLAALVRTAGIDEVLDSPCLSLLLAVPPEQSTVTIRSIAVDPADRLRLDRDEKVYLKNRHLPSVERPSEVELLQLLNAHRAMHGVDRLRLDGDLYERAKNAADELRRAAERGEETSPDTAEADATLFSNGSLRILDEKSAWMFYKEILADALTMRTLVDSRYVRVGMGREGDSWTVFFGE